VIVQVELESALVKFCDFGPFPPASLPQQFRQLSVYSLLGSHDRSSQYFFMFKRVEKRHRKKVEEEELGLDEDMKEILGMHDTDSEESESGSEQSSGGDIDEGQDGLPNEEDFGQSESDDEDVAKQPVITVQEALRDPIYLASLQPDIKACIVCPGKLFKTVKMVELHRLSKACMLPFPPHETGLHRVILLDRPTNDVLSNSGHCLPRPTQTAMPGTSFVEILRNAQRWLSHRPRIQSVPKNECVHVLHFRVIS